MPYSYEKIETGNEEDYLDYILCYKDASEVSILTFAKTIISKWKGVEKSHSLQKTKNYFRKLEHLLYLIFYEENSPYQRSIF